MNLTLSRILLLDFFLVLLSGTLHPEGPDTLWTKTYGGTESDEGYSVEQTSDSRYIIGGYTKHTSGWEYFYLIKTDSLGNPFWTKEYNIFGPEDRCNSVTEAYDNGYIAAGYAWSLNNFLIILRITSAGGFLWFKDYGGSGDDRGNCIKKTNDDNYIISGYTSSFGAGSYDIYVIKVDTLGDSLWSKTYGGTGNDRSFSIQQTSDCGYIIAGYTNSFGSGNFDFILVKIDSVGNELWTRTYGGVNEERSYAVQITNDGGYIIVGETYTYGAGSADVYLVKTDENGDILWTKTYGGTGLDEGFSVQTVSDGGYIIAGWTASTGPNAQDVYIIRTDIAGNVLWTKTIGGMNNDCGYSVQQTVNGEYIIVGKTSSFGTGAADVYLIKLSEDIPPHFDSTTIWTDTSYAGPFSVYSKVTDTSPIDSVRLYFKREEDPAWFYTDMMVGANDWYFEEIPIAFLEDDTVKYYIYAKDRASPPNKSSDPPGAPVNHYSFIANLVGLEETKDQIYKKKGITLIASPDPFTTVTRLEILGTFKNTKHNLSIYDASGRLVKSVKLTTNSCQLGAELKTGVYFLKFDGVNVGKVVKVK